MVHNRTAILQYCISAFSDFCLSILFFFCIKYGGIIQTFSELISRLIVVILINHCINMKLKHTNWQCLLESRVSKSSSVRGLGADKITFLVYSEYFSLFQGSCCFLPRVLPPIMEAFEHKGKASYVPDGDWHYPASRAWSQYLKQQTPKSGWRKATKTLKAKTGNPKFNSIQKWWANNIFFLETTNKIRAIEKEQLSNSLNGY